MAIQQSDCALALLINVSGELAASQLGRDVRLGPGDAAALLHADPATMTHAAFQHEGVVISRATLAPLVTNAEDKAVQLIPRRNAALRLLTHYLTAIRGDLTHADPTLCHLVATHIRDLVAAAIGAGDDGIEIAEARDIRAARLAAIKSDVVANAGDARLTLSVVAARHALSPRSVQLLFEGEGVTFSQFVLAQRLVRAHRMLSDPRCRGMTVTNIARASGFGDLSHFNRDFRHRYGASPSEVRAEARK